MACNDRQLTQAQLEAGYDQQRTGVQRAIRPFSGTPTVENVIDYLNRELCPAVQSSRAKVNEVFKQVADNAPSANPLAYYFSTNTANADPTVGRMRLNQAVQNTATVLRLSQSNGRLQDVQPWLDVMSGGPTAPLGVLTMVDAINPSRFLRFDLNTMTDQGAYWDLGVTIVESSDTNPFVDDEPVVIGFIAGVSAAGSTIPVAALSPIATDTFVGNVTAGTAAPTAVNLSTLAGAGLAFAAHTLDVTGSTSITVTSDQVQRAALTGAIVATANSNATLFAGILDNGSNENDRGRLDFVSSTSVIIDVTDDSPGDQLIITPQRAALTGDVTASQNSNATTIANDAVTNAKAANMASPRLKGRTTTSTGDPEDLTLVDSTSISWNTGTAGSISTQRAALTGEVTASANANATTVVRSTNFQSSPWTGDHEFDGQVRLGTVTSSSSTGSTNVTLGASATRLLLTGTGTITLGTVSGCVDGRVLVVEFTGTGEHTVSHDSATADAFACPGNVDLVINGRGGFLAVGRLGAAANWKILGVSNDLTTHANTWTATNTYSGAVTLNSTLAYHSVIAPTALSADQNNYTPTGWATSNLVRLSTNSGTTRTLTGAAAGTAGELKWLVNLGPGSISLDAASTSSTAANRWLHVSGTTFTISVNGVCGILYDADSSRWRPIYPNLII